MSAQMSPDAGRIDAEQESGWIRVPTVIDANGDRVVILHDDQGRTRPQLAAEVVLESSVGPRPPGHVVRFKDGNRLNCDPANLEWAVARVEGPDESRLARFEATRKRFEEMRKSLEGRPQSDSGELQAEDRMR